MPTGETKFNLGAMRNDKRAGSLTAAPSARGAESVALATTPPAFSVRNVALTKEETTRPRYM